MCRCGKTTSIRPARKMRTGGKSSSVSAYVCTTPASSGWRPVCPLPQHLRTVRHLRRREGEGPCGDVPKGGDGRTRRRDRDLGRRGTQQWFLYVDDCVEGIYRFMNSEYGEPLNLGTEEVLAVNELAQIIIDVSGEEGLTMRHVAGPQGVTAARLGRFTATRSARLGAIGRRSRDGLGPHV